MLVVWVVVICCLMSGVCSITQVCEELVHPINSLPPHYLEGRWALVAGSLSDAPSMEVLRMRDSITVYFSNSTYTHNNRFGAQCQYLHYNISMEGSTFTLDVEDVFEIAADFLYTSCPDCLVMRWIVNSSKMRSVGLYLLSRRRKVSLREMEELRAQLKCLHLPAPVVMDPSKELCPEKPGSQSQAAAAQNDTTIDQNS